MAAFSVALVTTFSAAGAHRPLQTLTRTLTAARPQGYTMVAEQLVTLAEVEEAAVRLGCRLKINGIGPAYKIELEWLAAPDSGEPELVGFSNGFSQPTGVVHLESIQVRQFTGYYALSRAERRRYMKLTRADENGLGLLLSVAVGCWIRERCPFGCKRAQLLAILDEPKQHATLVRYYRRLGFSPLRDVRNGPLRDALDLMTWGGEGKLMELVVEDFVTKWGPVVRRMGQKKASSPPAS